MISPLVSIIVPVYNVEAYLRECLDSILAQTYTNLEIILVNDGSTDSSGQICSEYAAKDTRVMLIDKPNGGLSSARNAGMQAAKGEYVYFIDSDDWIQPETVSACVQAMGDTNADFCFFNADSFTESGYGIPQGYHRTRQYEPGRGLDVLWQLCRNNEYHSSVPLLFFKNDFMLMGKLTFRGGIVYEDMLFTFQAYALATKVAYVNKNFYQRRYRDNSIMTSRTTPFKFRSAKTVYEQLIVFSEERGILEDETARRYIARCALNVINIFSRLTFKDKIACYGEFKAFKQDVLVHHAFSEMALRMRCHGYILWLVYKIYEKTLGRLVKG